MRKFESQALFGTHEKWQSGITRFGDLPVKSNEIRSEFSRDYTRILHCKAYRRLKHKTQVFFATCNDHVCTRMEHVNHVESISSIISNYFGLNVELASAIALGHDLGHAPFGHTGERVLEKLAKSQIEEEFWHEGNSLRFVDHIETLEDDDRLERNLCLTYAVRDGIICHCGEIDDLKLIPRSEASDLKNIVRDRQPPPFTWEGCVVKFADKIAYLGRDIEDALALRILEEDQIRQLRELNVFEVSKKIPSPGINNTKLISVLIADLCENSDPQNGICFSNNQYDLVKGIKKFSYDNIYKHPRILIFEKYAELIMNSIYDTLLRQFDGLKTLERLNAKFKALYPDLSKTFVDWLKKYSNIDLRLRPQLFHFDVLYNLENEVDYKKAIIEYISAMTDSYAIKVFLELIAFE